MNEQEVKARAFDIIMGVMKNPSLVHTYNRIANLREESLKQAVLRTERVDVWEFRCRLDGHTDLRGSLMREAREQLDKESNEGTSPRLGA